MSQYKDNFSRPNYDEDDEEILSAPIMATVIINKVVNDRINEYGVNGYPEKLFHDMSLEELRNYVLYFSNCVESNNYTRNIREENDDFKAFIPYGDIVQITKELNEFFNNHLESMYPGIIKIFDSIYLKGERWLGDIRYKILSATGTQAENEAYSALWYSIKIYFMCKYKWNISIETFFDIRDCISDIPYYELGIVSEELCRKGLSVFSSVEDMYQKEVEVRNQIIDSIFDQDIKKAFDIFDKCKTERNDAYKKYRQVKVKEDKRYE